MTSKGEALETSEFLRRRQLRLQQVREQSKDIAKKIRQRAKVEKLRQVVELDERKERDYNQSQEKVVKKLEELYSRGLNNVGSSHKQARGLTQPVNLVEKSDLSRLRGREAAAEVKRQKQQKLDELKKSLDRKLQAREAANELSRDKSASAANKLSKLSSKKSIVNEESKSASENVIEENLINRDFSEEVSKTDMATQWDIDLLPPEWEPSVPALALPQDDYVKESGGDKDNITGKHRKTDLFALSEEMPSSLRGGSSKPCITEPSKLSSTLVSEYIQNRVLRLREPEVNTGKRRSEDLKNLRQTITRSRPLNPEGSSFSNICHVVEGQAFPAPMWHAESGCQCHSPKISHHKQTLERKEFPTLTRPNKILCSIPVKPNSVPSPVLRKPKPLIPHRCCGCNELSVHANGFLRGKQSDNLLTKKKSVTTYDHSTRDTRDVQRADERLVCRDRSVERDAYSQALSESMSACNFDKPKTSQDSMNKIAVTRQNIEKEYKDTLAFLNSLPKSTKTRPINNAFKDDHRLQEQRENRQRILQQEFRNIEQESRRQDSQVGNSKPRLPDRNQSKRSKSPADSNVDNNLNERDIQYSWMPVPESDSKLAVHTIPTGARVRARDGRASHSVKFSSDDGYHEYRSRHRHTPPTKDTAGIQDKTDKKLVQTVIFQNDDDSSSAESVTSDNGSTDDKESEPKRNAIIDDSPKRRELTDTERIIIYKILNYKHRKKNKPTKINSTDDVAHGKEGLKGTRVDKIPPSFSEEAIGKDVERIEHVSTDNNPLASEHLSEGVYEVGKNKLSCNVLNCYRTNVDPWKSISQRNDWWDNLESMYYAGMEKAGDNQPSSSDSRFDKCQQGPCSRKTEVGDGHQKSRKKCSSAKCKGHSPKLAKESSPSTSEDTAAAASSAQDAGFVKLIDEGRKQQGNFYIGATGFLKNDAYEVIIQLRKNDAAKEVTKSQDKLVEPKTVDNENISKVNAVSPALEDNDNVVIPSAAVPPPSVTDLNSAIVTNNPGAKSTESDQKYSPTNPISDNVQPTKTTHDRSVSTSFNEPETLAKTESIAKPAMSTCTQTTPSPPNPRPVYIHMSSSTSTAYMSPPEVVLPNFLRRGDKACKKARRTSRNIETQEDRNFIHREHHCKSYSSCKIYEKMLSKPYIDRLNFYADVYREKNDFTPCTFMSNKRSKSNTRSASELCCEHHAHKMKHRLNMVKRNISTCNTKNANKRSKSSRQFNKLSNKSYLSPMVKQYINKLLSLDREGIQAIQILNQNCSSVNTPASSIINVPTNFSNKYYQSRNIDQGTRDLELLEGFLKQRIFLHNNASRTPLTGPDSETKSNNKPAENIKPRMKNTKNKKVHKVKSLNISKKIIVKTIDSTETKVKNSPQKRVVNEQDSPLLEDIKSYEASNDKKNLLKTLKITKDMDKHYVNQFVGDDSSSSQPKTASCNSNSNSEILSKPINISTQTSSRAVDGEINLIKLAEDKLQNMEKIADLTEKCTKRLSNLAKVLEEVRKNKSLAYSQVSTADSTSDSDQKSDKMVPAAKIDSKVPCVREDTDENCKNLYNNESTDYESLIPGIQKSSNIEFLQVQNSDNDLSENSNTEFISQSVSSVSTNDDRRENTTTKCRNRPPPALLRINLKRPQDNVVPHELSTVIEVDSPLSLKFKQQSSINTNHSTNNFSDPKKDEKGNVEYQLAESVRNIVNTSSNEKNKVISGDSSEELKIQMMDLNQFNEIMLRPFVSLQEYARDHYERSNTKRESLSKELGMTDDISSLHSDGSLPDVVAELLKRKLITEPFRFEAASNMNSTTISSESTLSVLALSKARKERSQSTLTANKENVAETSDSLSISSNPDLENAFKKLGMGWASSTLKKTKERLALSSSSNTSSSSLSQMKFKNSIKQDEPVPDAFWSVSNISRKPALKRRLDTSINAEQQTSFANNMTVKEFLTKELAKKITFTDKSNRNETNQEFVSLFETKLPDDFKNSPQTVLEDNSVESAPSGNNNRARTSTPVKLFKSVTYHSSSSSNISNGLFSNADELSSVKLTSGSVRLQSASEKDELTIPNCSLKMRKTLSDCSKTDSC